MPQKFYVVWKGKTPGVHGSWDECKEAVVGVAGAKYKSFATRAEADAAYRAGPTTPVKARIVYPPELGNSPSGMGIAVDGACSGSTGMGEYRGVLIPSMKQLFTMGPYEHSTNNIMEFLAIVKAFKWLHTKGIRMPIFSDSKIAMGWISGTGECRTKNPPPYGTLLCEEIMKAHRWLRMAETNGCLQEFKDLLVKWKTSEYGEIPADFGRK
jgi:ribonuclease HI